MFRVQASQKQKVLILTCLYGYDNFEVVLVPAFASYLTLSFGFRVGNALCAKLQQPRVMFWDVFVQPVYLIPKVNYLVSAS